MFGRLAVVVLTLTLAGPAGAEVLGFDAHLTGGYTAYVPGSGFDATVRAPLGLDAGVSTGLVPLLRLQFYAAGMTLLHDDAWFGAGARVLYALSDHFDLGAAGAAGYAVDFDAKSGNFAWMAGPHLQFHFILLNVYLQPTYARGLYGGGGVIYPLFGGVGIQF